MPRPPFEPSSELPTAQQLSDIFETIGERYGALLGELGAKLALIRMRMRMRMPDSGLRLPDPAVVAATLAELIAALLANPATLAEIQSDFCRRLLILQQRTLDRLRGSADSAEALPPLIEPAPDDRRFDDPLWRDDPRFDFVKQVYLLAARSVLDAARLAPGLSPQTRRRAEFYLRLALDALAPTNFALTNPRVLAATRASGGANLLTGLRRLIDDVDGDGDGDGDGARGRRWRVSRSDPRMFTLGRDLATTPGQVVHQTRLMQLLQYAPSTSRVRRRPLLIVPPWINKYYILDLRPKNSFVRWAVAQGFTVFVISWVNPRRGLADCDFEDYLRDGTLAALRAIGRATGETEVDALGYCLGGTLLASTLAWLAAGARAMRPRIASATLLTTLLRFDEIGKLGVFIDEPQIAAVERQMRRDGYLRGDQMSAAFDLLRANDLIWSFWINGYLLGNPPPAFDLLYWNDDATRMPARMHSFYLRNMYLDNRLCRPGGVTLLGRPIDLRSITAPLYVLATRNDHIAPWRGAYRSALLPRGPARFVLGGSGHIAGVVNPPGAHRYGYRTHPQLPPDPDAWLARAEPQPGSWWTDWRRWIGADGSDADTVPARRPGDGRLTPLEPAPGSYVRVRLD